MKQPNGTTHLFISKTQPMVYVMILGVQQYHWSSKKCGWYEVDMYQMYSLESLTTVVSN